MKPEGIDVPFARHHQLETLQDLARDDAMQHSIHHPPHRRNPRRLQRAQANRKVRPHRHPRVREPALAYRATMGIAHEVRSPEDLHSPAPHPTLHP